MSGFSRIRKKVPFIVGVGLLCLPSVLNAQTGAERARAEERARAFERARAEELAQVEKLHLQLQERLQFTEQERLARVEEARFRAQKRLQYTEQERLERMAEAEFRVQEELARVKAVHEVRAREIQEIGQERAREVESRIRAVQRAQFRAQEDYQRARQEVRRAQQVMVQVKSRVRLGVSLDGNQGVEYDGLGVRLSGTLEESPAEEAGLLEGDIITHLNGQSLLEPIAQEAEADFDDEGSLPVQRLMALAQELEAGEDVEVRYLRDGSPQTVSFQTAEIDEPTITVLRGGDDGEAAYRILRKPGGGGVYRVGPDRGGVWTFEGPDQELVELQISKMKKLKELGELEELAELEDLKIHLKDLNLEVQNLDGVGPNFLLRSGQAGPWTVRSRGAAPLMYAFRGGSTAFGLKLAEMNPGLAEYFTSDEGLLVLEAPEDSSLGLLPGDVVLEIDGRAVESQEDVMRILGSYEKDEAVSFTVVRKGRETMVEGTVG